MTQPGHTAPLTVLIVDDHPLVRRGLADVVRDEPDMIVVGEAATADEAMPLIRAQRPAVAVIDLWLGAGSGLELVQAVAQAAPEVAVLVLSAHDERVHAERALQAGAKGYIMKDRAAGEFVEAVRRVASGRSYVSAEMADHFLATFGAPPTAAGRSGYERLSDRERHVLVLIARGLSTSEIAAELDLSVKTLETHYARIKAKLGLRNARELTRAAYTFTTATKP